jgi:hypothetical protein
MRNPRDLLVSRCVQSVIGKLEEEGGQLDATASLLLVLTDHIWPT